MQTIDWDDFVVVEQITFDVPVASAPASGNAASNAPPLPFAKTSTTTSAAAPAAAAAGGEAEEGMYEEDDDDDVMMLDDEVSWRSTLPDEHVSVLGCMYYHLFVALAEIYIYIDIHIIFFLYIDLCPLRSCRWTGKLALGISFVLLLSCLSLLSLLSLLLLLSCLSLLLLMVDCASSQDMDVEEDVGKMVIKTEYTPVYKKGSLSTSLFLEYIYTILSLFDYSCFAYA